MITVESKKDVIVIVGSTPHKRLIISMIQWQVWPVSPEFDKLHFVLHCAAVQK